MDPYAILGVHAEATADEIRRAYHARCLQLHPDKAQAADQTEFHVVQDAWKLLSDLASRQAHDESVRRLASRLDEETRMAERVGFDQMQQDGASDSRSWPCRCGSTYQLAEHELEDGALLVPCEGCSLSIYVER
jgi:DnaJ-class molecular chaperone